MNLQGKLSGLKGLVSHSPSKRRYKADLTVDMISPPLGDFRHTMHVGRGGDVFGDTSFLSNHGGTANGNGDADSVSAPDNKIGAFFTRTLRHVRKTSDSSPRAGAKDLSPPPPPISPIIKNAISLPRLDVDLPNGSPTAKVLFPKPQTSSAGESRCSYGLESGFVTLPRHSRSERQQPSISVPTSCSPGVHRGSLTDATDAILSTCSTLMVTSDPTTAGTTTAHSDSLPSLTSLDTFTFTLDLGPSLMSEVFGLIDGADGQSDGTCHAWEVEEAGSACGLTNEGSEMDSATISYVDSLLREDCSSRKSPYGAEWEDEEEEVEKTVDINGGGHPLQGPVPDIVMGSPGREKMGMGKAVVSERFHGVGGLSKGQNRMDSEMVIMNEMPKKMSFSYVADDEEEIKV